MDDGEEEKIDIVINKYPVQLIAIEKCINTLDYYILKNKITDNELSCIMIQIIMTLITYQKTFNLTHNDLHSNNIMYINTDIKYICYKINNQYYKIQTYGKIFKIIDYGRSIYKYKNRLICSNSFNFKGDAATQYNFGPYFNKNKKLVEPNYSFDLCRLGCSLYDYYIDNINNSEIKKIICDWCNDDMGENVLYNKKGYERYKDFNLYKMIARNVNNHIPINVLKKSYFNQYLINNIENENDIHFINIDDIPICI